MLPQRTNSTQPVLGVIPEETASEAKTIVSRNNSEGKRRRSKKMVTANKSLFERARDNPALRYVYILFLCTLLPFVAIYTYVRTVYFTERSERHSSREKVPDDSDDSSATESQDSSEHASSSSTTSDDYGDKRSLELDTRRFLTEEDSLFEIQRRSLKKRTATERAASVPKKEDYTLAKPKSGFWKSLSNSNQVLKVILVEDSSF